MAQGGVRAAAIHKTAAVTEIHTVRRTLCAAGWNLGPCVRPLYAGLVCRGGSSGPFFLGGGGSLGGGGLTYPHFQVSTRI